MRPWIVALLLSGCAASTQAPQDSRLSELQGRVAGPPRSCVTPAPGQGLSIIADGTVGSRSGRTIWINRLPANCPGLRPLNTLIIEAHGSQICRGDRIRVIEPGVSIPGPVCILGDFVPYRQR